jgi:hypothetical protein
LRIGGQATLEEKGVPGPEAAAVVIVFSTEGDYVHQSGNEVSAHGWWIQYSGPSGVQANVDVQLQIYVGGWGWINIGPNFTSNVYPGGGSGQRTTARQPCPGGGYTWRSVVDVDLIGYADSDEKLYTPGRYIDC